MTLATAPPNPVHNYFLKLDILDLDATGSPRRSEDCGAGSAKAVGSPPGCRRSLWRAIANLLKTSLPTCARFRGNGHGGGLLLGTDRRSREEPVFTKFLSSRSCYAV